MLPTVRRLAFTALLAVTCSAGAAWALRPLVADYVFHAPSLEHSLLGTSPERDVRVYLPPGYYDDNRRYPVVYVLHGYGAGNKEWSDWLIWAAYPLWEQGAIQPMILVAPDVIDPRGGSFYANTPVTGNWEDFITRDLVEYVDRTFRTVPQASSRGLLGHSMGATGAMRLAMLHPDLFSVVYARSGSLGAPNLAGKIGILLGAMGPILDAYLAAFVPDLDAPPGYFDPPYEIVDGEVVVQEDELASAFANDPLDLLPRYADNLRRLRGVAFDVGTQDQWLFIPPSNRWFDAALDSLGIEHLFEEYEGDHLSGLAHALGEQVFPFIAERLAGQPERREDVAGWPAVVQARVGEPLALEVRVTAGGDGGADGSMDLDLSCLGQASVALRHEGDGRYSGRASIAAALNGHYDLPVWLTAGDGERRIVHWVSVNAWPPDDAEIADESLGAGWSYTGTGGAQEPVFASPLTPASGERVAAFSVEPASFVGWVARLETEEPMARFGYSALAFWFHPGTATGRSLNLAIGDDSMQLVGLNAGDVHVDLGLPEWQQVVVPLEALRSLEPVNSVQLSGSLSGTFYLDGLRFVADGQRPDVGTPVLEMAAAALPLSVVLEPNYPNPFNGRTLIRFALPEAGRVQLGVYNVLGQRVASLIDGWREAGTHECAWDGTDGQGRAVASGAYLYSLRNERRMVTRGLLLVQ